MATGGHTVEKHSEEIMDFVCTPCTTKQRSRRAETFCETCNKYFCEKCLSFHDEIFTDHDLLGPEDFENKPAALLPSERCGHHRNEILQVYCREHDEVVCNTCVSMQHGTCTVVYIPTEVKNLLSATQIAAVKEDLDISLKTLKNDENSREVKRRELSDKKSAILESVENHGQMLKAAIDGLVNNSKKDIEEKYQLIEGKLQEEMTKNKNEQTELEESVNKLDIAEKQKNDSQVFVSLKKSQVKMAESKKHHDDYTTWRDTVQLEFDFNRDIQKGLKKFTSLGSVIDQLRIVPDQHTQPSLYKVKRQKSVQVCQERICSIAGSCQVPDGSFLVTDYTHQKIVQLDSSCSRITDLCPVPDKPYDVCMAGDKEAAVSLFTIKTIQFVSLGANMTLTRSVKFQHTCEGIAFSQGELFVSDLDSHVHVYDIAGKPLRNLGNSTSGQRSAFGETDHIVVSSDGQKVYVADHDLGLVCVDRNGKHMFTYRDSQLQNVRGVCLDDRGGVFVCGCKSGIIIQLSGDGKLLGVLLQQSDGLQKPVSVCFDPRNKRILVTKVGNNSVSVYELE